MAHAGRNRQAVSGRDTQKCYRKDRVPFADAPLSHRPKLFCCPVAETREDHLPRCFVNPGRHLMNQQLKTFLESADDEEYTFSKCEVSHMVEVTARALCNNAPPPSSHSMQPQEQWNVFSGPVRNPPVDNIKTPLDSEDSNMALDQEALPYSTYQSMSTRYFITQNSSHTWQIPPHSRQYRDNHPDPNNGRIGLERYMEIPPFRTIPYTSESTSGGGTGAREWIPSCSILMWCTRHNTFYEVHVLS
ncbi:hypothetical protein LTR46_008779 [Exophiala xenobiotica]|nr:hypothetical protein LTR46_008779 [Exophiala xenobiotica]